MKNIFFNSLENRPRAWLRLISFFLISGIILGGIILIIVSGIPLFNYGVLPDEVINALHNLMIVSIIAALVFGLAYIISSKWLDRRKLTDIGFRFSSRWWGDFAFGIALGAILLSLVFGVELWAGWISIEGFFRSSIKTLSFTSGLLQYVVAFICVGIYEEIITRGYLMRNLAEGLRGKYLSPRNALLAAYVLSSIVFGLLHFLNAHSTAFSTLCLVGTGLLLGLGYLFTGELAIPIGLHTSWDFFEGVVYGFPVSGIDVNASIVAIKQSRVDIITGGAFGPEAGIVGFAAIIVGALLLLLYIYLTRGKIKVKDDLAIYLPP
jgi:membrane protease YdiL (CAAX protease family)